MGRLAFLFLTVTLAACSRQPAGQQDPADALDNAARQSDPQAASELHNAADAARDMNISENISDPDSFAQNSLQTAGNQK